MLMIHFHRIWRRLWFGSFTCLKREDWGAICNNSPPLSQQPKKDYWEQSGMDRTCSFCGSMHPEDFRKACIDIIAGTAPQYTFIEVAKNSPSVVYLHRTWERPPSHFVPMFLHLHGDDPHHTITQRLINHTLETSLWVANLYRQSKAHEVLRSTRTRIHGF